MPPRQRPDPETALGWSLVSVQSPEGESIIFASGEFDVAAIPDVHRVIGGVVGSMPSPRVVIDLSGVTFLDAAMLGSLVFEREVLLAAGGDLIVAGVSEWSLRVIEICGLRETLGL